MVSPAENEKIGKFEQLKQAFKTSVAVGAHQMVEKFDKGYEHM